MHKVAQQGVAKLEHVISQRADELSWDDLRIFLVCAESVSFRDGARILKLAPSTVARRIERLEASLGVQLFHRLPEGGRLTPDGKLLLDSAKSMQQSLLELERKRASLGDGEAGEVTIAVTEGLGTYWVMPRLVEFQRQNPKIIINLLCAMESVDVLRLEADISLQFIRPQCPDLIASRLGKLHIYPFAAQNYLDLYGTPSTYEDMAHHRLVEQVAPQLDKSALARYFRLSDPSRVIGVRTNTSTAHFYAVEKGAGIGGLPTFALPLGAPVVPVDIGEGYSVDIWLTYRSELRKTSYKSAAVDWIRSIFDPGLYPWFRDQFIHPARLHDILPDEADANMGLGFYSVDPTKGVKASRGR